MDLAARAAVVQPSLDGDLLAFVLADVLDVYVRHSPLTLPETVPSAAAPAAPAPASPSSTRCAVELEHERAVVADLLHRRQRRRPVDRAVERQQVIVGCARRCRARASRSGAPTPSRSRRPRRRRCARGRSRGRCRHRRRDRPASRRLRRNAPASPRATARSAALRPRSARPAAAPAASVLRRCAAPPRACPARRFPDRAAASAGCRGARPAPGTAIRRAMCSARSASPTARARASASALAIESVPLQRPPVKRSAIGAWMLSQLEAGFGQPLLQIGDRRRVVVVEMRPGREHLDQLEAVRRDLQQVIAATGADRGRGASTPRYCRLATRRNTYSIEHDD